MSRNEKQWLVITERSSFSRTKAEVGVSTANTTCEREWSAAATRVSVARWRHADGKVPAAAGVDRKITAVALSIGYWYYGAAINA